MMMKEIAFFSSHFDLQSNYRVIMESEAGVS